MAAQSEQKEKTPETKTRPEFRAEADFDPSKEWNDQVLKLVRDAMGARYQRHMNAEILTYLTTGKDYKTFQERRADIMKMRLEAGTVTFLDKEGKAVASFDIAAGMRELIEMAREHDCEICRRRTRRLMRYQLRDMSYAEMLRRIYGEQLTGPGSRSRAGTKPPELTDEQRREMAREAAANARLQAILHGEKVERDMILATAETMEDEEYDILAYVSPTVQDDLEKNWRFMDGNNAVDDLFHEEPDPAEGYRVNPFNLSPEKRWNRAMLQELIQKWRNDRLYFREVGDVIYKDRFEDFKQDLEKSGVQKPVTDLLDGKDLQKDYKKLKKISTELEAFKNEKDVPEEHKDLWPHREGLKVAVQTLGDYIVYATKLVNAINDLRYNPAKPADDRERLMFEFERGAGGAVADNPANRVKESLHELFLYDVASAREYSGELSQIFLSDDSHRKITFQDLNGRTATVETEWFTQYQSPQSAYKLAFEEIEQQRKNEGGAWTGEIGPEQEQNAVAHINDLLQLGITAYSATPGHRPLKEIIDGLEAKGATVREGVPLRFTGNLETDVQNLWEALSISRLADLKKKGTDAEKLVAKERLAFVRIGSVVFQKNSFEHQTRLQEQRERKTLAVIGLKSEQIESVIGALRASNRFSGEKLAQIKQRLLGGVGVVLGQHPGAGLAVKYDLGDGWILDLMGGGGPDGALAGVGAGKKFEVRRDIEITIHAGPGYLFGDTSGWLLGAGGSITKKFSSVDVSFQTGIGILLGPAGVIPSIPIGVGFDWGKEKEKFQETLTKKQLDAKIAQLDQTPDPYDEVKKNPGAYPQLAQILYAVDMAADLDPASRKELFAAAYGLFKDGLKSEAIDETTPRWWERFLPTGVNLGVVLVGGTVPVPYAALTFNLWSRKLVYRIASPLAAARDITEAQAREALLKNVQGAQQVEPKTLLTTKEIVVDPKTGRFMLRRESTGAMDFKELAHMNRFQQLRDALSRDAKIFIDPADIEGKNFGLILLSPQEAHGDVEVYVDPELKDDVIVVTRGSKLYLSVKKDREICIKREDLTFPFQERGATEKTTITISGNPHLKTDVIKAASGWYMDRTPTSQWVRRPAVSAETPAGRERQKQDNLMASFQDYEEWWAAGKDDRLEFTTLEGLHESYDRLRAAVTLKTETAIGHLRIRPEVQDRITALAENADFIQSFRRLSTDGFNYANEKTVITADWRVDFPELTRLITREIGQDGLTPDELNAAMLEFTIASFINIQREGDEKAKEKFANGLKGFEQRLFTSIFDDYYRDAIPDDAARAQKVKESVEWMTRQLEQVDVTAKADPGQPGMLFATTVGMGRITGLRRMVNYFEGKDPKWGVVGRRLLDVKAKGPAGDVADFWLQRVSPYTPGLHHKEIPDPKTQSQEYLKFQDALRDNLRSPLALKLALLIAVTLTPSEMDQLTEIYEGPPETAQVLITKENIGPVRKLLDWCDKVRQAELNGEKEVALDANFKIVLDIKVSMGIYKECGNITGLMTEEFGLVYLGGRKIYFAGMGEGLMDVAAQYDRVDFKAMLGLAVPIPQPRRAAPAEPGPRKPPGAPTGEVPRFPPARPGKPTFPTAQPVPPPQPVPGRTTGASPITPETDAGSAGE